jgi:hypothetical protein
MVELAQLAEHQIVVLRVMGSNPIFHPKKLNFFVDILRHLFIIDASINIFRIFNMIFFYKQRFKNVSGRGAIGSVLALGARGCEFESRRPDHKNLKALSLDSAFFD